MEAKVGWRAYERYLLDAALRQGVIKPGEDVDIVGIRKTQKTTVTGVEMFHKMVRPALGLLLLSHSVLIPRPPPTASRLPSLAPSLSPSTPTLLLLSLPPDTPPHFPPSPPSFHALSLLSFYVVGVWASRRQRRLFAPRSQAR